MKIEKNLLKTLAALSRGCRVPAPQYLGIKNGIAYATNFDQTIRFDCPVPDKTVKIAELVAAKGDIEACLHRDYELPDPPELVEGEWIHNLGLSGLLEVSAAAAKTKLRYALKSVCLSVAQKNASTYYNYCATDARVMAWTSDRWPAGGDCSLGLVDKKIRLLVPVDTARLIGLLGWASCNLIFSAGRLQFERDNVILFSRATDGVFPDWEGLIPAPGGAHDVGDALGRLKAEATMAKARLTDDGPVIYDFGRGKWHSPDMSSSAGAFDGFGCYSYEYIRVLHKILGRGLIKAVCAGPEEPALFFGESGVSCLVMPVVPD